MLTRTLFLQLVIVVVALTGLTQTPENQYQCDFDIINQARFSSFPEEEVEFENSHHLLSLQTIAEQRAFGKNFSTPIDGIYYIPVVFHVIHSGENEPENIPYGQIQHQMQVLNEAFSGYVNEEQAYNGVETNIRFCLAQEIANVNLTWTNENEPGVMRYEHPSLSTFNSAFALGNFVQNAPGVFPFDQYLNIYVVKTISYSLASAVYTRVSEWDMETLTEIVYYDGITIESNVVGSVTLGDDGLDPNYNHGRTLVHEIGHYLELLHTHSSNTCQGGSMADCAFDGDNVCDTPPCVQNFTCLPGIENTCIENIEYSLYPSNNYLFPTGNSTDYYDMEANFMGYTSEDLCHKTFTQGQADRMVTALNSPVYGRDVLSSIPNLIATGLAGADGCIQGDILTAVFDIESGAHCPDDEILFSSFWGTGFSADSWTWDFGDGTVLTDNIDGEIVHTYSEPGEYTVSLLSTDGFNVEYEVAQIIISDCAAPEPEQSNWIYGKYVGINFTSGAPEVDGIAYDNSDDPNDSNTLNTLGATICQSDQNGQLLFYSDGNTIWQPNGEIVANNLSDNNFKKTLICVPYPGHPNQYFLLTGYSEVSYHIINVDETTQDVTLVESVILSLENDHEPGEWNFAVPHCNGIDYWIISVKSTITLVYLLTINGLSNSTLEYTEWMQNLQPDIYPNDINSGYYICDYFGSTLGCLYREDTENGPDPKKLITYSFNNITGELSLVQNLEINTLQNLTFSTVSCKLTSDQHFLYFYGNQDSGNYFKIHRVELLNGNLIDTGLEPSDSPFYGAFQRGPEQIPIKKMYAIPYGSLPATNYLSVFHSPSNQEIDDTQFQSSIVSYESLPGMENGFGFPDFIDADNIPIPSTGEVLLSNFIDCNTVQFAVPSCFSLYPVSWNFGDGSPISNLTNVVHEFQAGGIFTVSLSFFPESPNPLIYQLDFEIIDSGSPVISFDPDVCIGTPFELLASNQDGLGVFNWTIVGNIGVFTATNSTSDQGELVSALFPESGNYIINVTNGCFENETAIELTVHNNPIVELSLFASCTDQCNGVGMVEVSYEQPEWPEYEVYWTNSENEVVGAGLSYCEGCAGSSITATTTDQYGCSSIVTGNIIGSGMSCDCNGEPILITETISNGCSAVENSITIALSGGNPSPNYSIQWQGPNGFNLFGATTISELSPGSYFVLVTDGNGCMAQEAYTIGQSDFPFGLTVFPGDPDILSDQTLSFGGDLIFENGVTATYLFSNLSFASGNRIIIKEGANISFRFSSFTACESNWKGFEVLSDELSDNSLAAGSLNLQNCEIKFAEIAISTKDGYPLYESVQTTDQNGNIVFVDVPAYEGGLISVSNTLFQNNLRSIKVQQAIRWAQNTPETSFTNCTFTVNDDLANHFTDWDLSLPWNSFKSHVMFDEVIGYGFINCTFDNKFINIANQGGWGAMGVGIKSFNARFEVNINDDEGVQSLFDGFKFAIQAHNTDGFWNFMRIVNSKFRNNQVAMYFHDVCFHDVIGNQIFVGPNITLPDVLENAEVDYEGIYQLNGAFYIMAENEITGVGEPIEDNFFVGIRIRDSQARDNEVYHNYLTNLTRGCQAEGDNTGNGIWENYGLRFVCNQFVNCNSDLTCTDFNNNNLMEVSHDQFGLLHDDEGVPIPLIGNDVLEIYGKRANNDFTESGFIDQEDHGQWQNEGSVIKYWCGAESECPYLDQENPENSLFLNLEFFETVDETYINNCTEVPGIIFDGIQITYPQLPASWQNQFNNWDDQVEVGKYLKLALIDDGDTESLQSAVAFAWTEDTWDMRDLLLSKSPYLSRDVLRSVADNTTTFPHPVALEIFIANPDVLRDATFMRYLEEKINPMPNSMVDILYASRYQNTMRTLIDRNMAIANAYQAQTLSVMTRIWLNNYSDNVLAMYSHMNLDQMFDYYRLIDEYLNSGNVVAALSAYQQMGSIKMNDIERRDYETYGDWITLSIDTKDWLNGVQLSSTQTNTLNTLVDNYWMHRAGQKAMAFMNKTMNTDFYIPPARNSWQPRSLSNNSLLSNGIENVEVFPNPSDQLVNISANLNFVGNKQLTLSIYDSTNRLVKSIPMTQNSSMITLDTRDWSAGLYLYILRSEDKQFTGKFEIQH